MKKICALLLTLCLFNSVFSQSSSNEMESLILAATKAFNEHNIKEYLSYFSDDAIFYNTVDYKDSAKGKQAIEQRISGWFTIVPDLTAKVNRVYTSGDTVIDEFNFSGTIRGALPGYPENIKDKSFNLKACAVNTVENGKVKITNMYWDYLSLLNQLGWTNIVPGH